MDEYRSQFTNVYVKNLADNVTDDELNDLFSQYGKITSAVVSRDESGQSKGFGFINFEDHEDASKAVDALHESQFHDQELYVSRAQKKGEREEELRRQYENAKLDMLNKYQGVNLYIKNLDDDITDGRIRQEFSAFGVITSAKIMRDEKTNASRGFGFVCFSSPEEATRAVTEMNGRMVGSKPIYVALAQRKDVRRSQLEAQMSQRNQMRAVPGNGFMPPMFYAPPVFPMPRPRWAPQQPFPGPPQGFPQQQQQQQQRPPRGPRPPRVKRDDDFQQQPPLTASALAAAAPELQKQMLGERLYPLM